ncbi:MAG: glycosyltransferase [Planctomycetota bacterium]
MKYDTALREYVHQKIAEIGGKADIVIGIPTFNSENTIAGVLRAVGQGLAKHYPDRRAVVLISDGGSLDYTRENAQRTKLAAHVTKIVAIYRGLPGKGTSLRAVFEAAARLNASACAVFDSDLRSITGDWVKALVDPILSQGYDFVSPYYVRHKYDGTITNNIARALTQALYGKRIRQPIGGDFGFSRNLVERFTKEDVWETDVARFGIDIWMTTIAICEGFRVCEAFLGAKVHDPKDPSASLGPMWRQVVGTLFGAMSRYEQVWKKVVGSEAVPLLGEVKALEPEPIQVDHARLVSNFREGLGHFGALWREVVSPESFAALEALAKEPVEKFHFPIELWVRVVYDFAYTFQRWSRDKYKLVDLMTPLYYGRTAGFITDAAEMTTEQADEIVDLQAQRFEDMKPYLLSRFERWEGRSAPVDA